jgi:N-methylhydantoinase A
MIDVEGIGAGGGSIAWVDKGGALNVGPRSAGADPGPACYGLGGELPTVTDANLVLGRLNPEYFLGAEMPLYPDRAREAIRRWVAEPLGLSVEEAAAGIIRVVNANMVRGISVNSTQKGYDVREFALLAFGGAGPLHAAEMAEDLGMRSVLIPPYCSVFSALGAVASDVRHDYVQTVAMAQADLSAAGLEAAFAELEAEARRLLSEEKVPEERIRLLRSADLRYQGQSYELTIPLSPTRPLDQASLDHLVADFHRWHERIYAYSDPKESVEVISLRLAAIGEVPDLKLRRRRRRSGSVPSPKARRAVYFPGVGFRESTTFERTSLAPGHTVEGPCLIEEETSTTVVPPAWKATVDGYGVITLTRR